MLDRNKYYILGSETKKVLGDFHNIALEHPDNYVIGDEDFVPVISELYKAMYDEIGKEKVYYLSKNIEKRVEGMDIENLVKSNEGVRMLLDKNEIKYIIPSSTHTIEGLPLNAAYLVKDGKFYMQVWNGDYKTGYVIYDPDCFDRLAFIVHSPFDMAKLNSYPKAKDMYESTMVLLEMIKKDFGAVPEPTVIYRQAERSKKTLDAFTRKRTAGLVELHLKQLGALIFAFNCFVFLKTAEVYSEEYIRDHTPTYFRKKGHVPLNYTLVDCTWDKNIDVNSPFPVRGHFKMQACKKEGEWTHKLIFVEPYMKTGYHRRAKKVIEYERETAN